MILVTGGAGYIGSHTVRELKEKGEEIVIFDNFENSFEEVPKKLGVKYVKGDLRNKNDLKKLDSYKFDACLHFAAYFNVGESTLDPKKYFENNVTGTLNLLNYLISKDVKRFIFSSTSEVYGEANYLPIDEKHPLMPINPYGLSKRMVEIILEWFDEAYGMNYVSLRYFNAAGCSMDGLLGEMHKDECHLIPNVVLGVLGKKEFRLTCSNKCKTPDKTPIRDYIHVEDLARAHYLAYKYLKKSDKSDSFNLGSGKGYSVLEIIKAVENLTGVKIKKSYTTPRKGEPDKKYASNIKARKSLRWKPERTLEDIVTSTYDFFKNQ